MMLCVQDTKGYEYNIHEVLESPWWTNFVSWDANEKHPTIKVTDVKVAECKIKRVGPLSGLVWPEVPQSTLMYLKGLVWSWFVLMLRPVRVVWNTQIYMCDGTGLVISTACLQSGAHKSLREYLNTIPTTRVPNSLCCSQCLTKTVIWKLNYKKTTLNHSSASVKTTGFSMPFQILKEKIF